MLVLIYGPPLSAKTTLARELASRYKSSFYVDLSFIKTSKQEKLLYDALDKNEYKSSQTKTSKTKKDLKQGRSVEVQVEKTTSLDKDFIDSYDIYIFDNFKDEFFLLAGLKNAIVITKEFIELKDYKAIKTFSFDYATLKAKHDCNLPNFIKHGNNPSLYDVSESKRLNLKLQSLKLALGEDLDIFLHLLEWQSCKVSFNFLYKKLRLSMKISKDRIYLLLHKLESHSIIFTKTNRLYFYDFSLGVSLGLSTFMQSFENMVFLELIALGFELVASKQGTFESTKFCFLCLPFASGDILEKRLKKISLLNSKVAVAITMSYELKGVNILALPFERLPLLLDERLTS
ncbi:hypothetical protein BKH43_06155 [Helicobacter sp. 13S00401-1]|uniref:hypothetical protein n=1 Tax=Helicobacter sp. 13S00401-1 TaxID=1905758 RepID=UPI000BA51247|nr:hypothetical protein [Helicobacter sp. 13S00401-1]PAF50073.1 hypothetical protein BKH43_06155 [Helicobacter sp. 13S00401-1]